MNAPPQEVQPRLELARRAAQEAGRLTLGYFRRDGLRVDRKSDDSPVTIADREAEELLRRLIAREFPDDAILGEEAGETAGRSGYRWILDPIDGTKSFIHGVPLYTTLVGVEHAGESQLGVIYAPATRELVSAARGGPANYETGEGETKEAHVSRVGSLSQSLVLTSDVRSFAKDRKIDASAAYRALEASSRLCRTWGDAYGYLLVATGRAEVMIDPIMNVWDAAAILPILAAAGGTFTDWRGQPTIHGGEGIGTNGLVLDEVLSAIQNEKP